MIEIATYDPDEIFEHIKNGGSSSAKIELCGYIVSAASVKLATLKRNRVCVSCGSVGNRFILEKAKEHPGPHLNLYANWTYKYGKEWAIIMTKDHIVPKSLGGNNGTGNMQTMCRLCNTIKGNSTLAPVQVGMVRGVYDYATYLVSIGMQYIAPHIIAKDLVTLIKNSKIKNEYVHELTTAQYLSLNTLLRCHEE